VKVVLVGATGLLGTQVLAQGNQRAWKIIAPTKSELDITSDLNVTSFFLHTQPDWIINCAAFTNVDLAESQPDDAMMLNSYAPYLLASVCKWTGARLLHISTDYVFSGKKKTPYKENDKPAPLSAYAKTKRAGEINALQEFPKTVIVRTAWLFGEGRSCFPAAIIKAAKEGQHLRVVNDQTGSPSYTPDVAMGICALIESNPEPGYYHIVNQEPATRYQWACECLKAAGIKHKIQPITSDEWPTPAKRPKNSALSCERYLKLKLPPLPNWREATQKYLTMAQI
jgi:dTDP-4-dehydrorhamnose reductase